MPDISGKVSYKKRNETRKRSFEWRNRIFFEDLLVRKVGKSRHVMTLKHSNEQWTFFPYVWKTFWVFLVFCIMTCRPQMLFSLAIWFSCNKFSHSPLPFFIYTTKQIVLLYNPYLTDCTWIKYFLFKFPWPTKSIWNYKLYN